MSLKIITNTINDVSVINQYATRKTNLIAFMTKFWHFMANISKNSRT